jgi:hypothetical protein
MSAESQDCGASRRLLQGNGSANPVIAKQWLSSRRVKAVTHTHATIEEMLEAMFSVRSVPRLCNENQLPLTNSPSRVRVERESAGSQLRSCCCENLVAETWDSSGTQRKRNVRRWKPLPSSALKTVTENTSLCVILIFKV